MKKSTRNILFLLFLSGTHLVFLCIVFYGIYTVHLSQHQQLPYHLPLPSPTSKTEEVLGSAYEVLQDVNVYRLSHHLVPFHASNRTCQFADVRSQEVMKNWSHQGFYARARSKTFPYAGLAMENLAKGFSNDHDVTPTWIGSRTHRENLLLPGMREVCIEKKNDEKGVWYYVMEGIQ